MIDWKSLQARLDDITYALVAPSLDNKKRKELQQEQSHLRSLIDKNTCIERLQEQIKNIEQLFDQSNDTAMNELYAFEKDDLSAQLKQLHYELDETLFPADPLDNRSVFLEVRAGTGGQEAALFAADLLKMYTNYALSKGWQASLAEMSTTDLGGIREAILHIEGKGCFGSLKYESGVHRVQRVPKTETSGRIHTSTATVAVLAEAQEVDISINPSDLRIDTYRAGGAGGQHVNKTDSAVRITHIPTGTVVACQDERSQHKNRARAMKILQSRVLADQQEKQSVEISQQRKEMVGAGLRSEKSRTYNYPQNRITDHQIELTVKKLDIIMQGPALQEFIDPLMEKGRSERRNYPILKK